MCARTIGGASWKSITKTVDMKVDQKNYGCTWKSIRKTVGGSKKRTDDSLQPFFDAVMALIMIVLVLLLLQIKQICNELEYFNNDYRKPQRVLHLLLQVGQ